MEFIFSSEDRIRLRMAVENSINECSGVERNISLTLLALLKDFEPSERVRLHLTEAFTERLGKHNIQLFNTVPEEQLAEIDKHTTTIAEKLKLSSINEKDLQELTVLLRLLPALTKEVRRLKMLMEPLLLEACDSPVPQ